MKFKKEVILCCRLQGIAAFHMLNMNPRCFYRQLWPVSTGYQLIRIGGDKDGGYLVPDVLSGIQLCLSPGTAGYVELEKQLGQIYGIPSLLCDPEEDAPDKLPEYMRFDRIALAGVTGKGTMTLGDWTKKYALEDSFPYILTMDIEGSEVEVINSLSEEELLKIRIATIEFHYLHSLHTKEVTEYTIGLYSAVERMSQYFDVVHMRPNNHCPFYLPAITTEKKLTAYSCIEVTFLSKMMRKHPPRMLEITELPNPLDILNNPDKPAVDYTFYTLARKLTMS